MRGHWEANVQLVSASRNTHYHVHVLNKCKTFFGQFFFFFNYGHATENRIRWDSTISVTVNCNAEVNHITLLGNCDVMPVHLQFHNQ